MNSNQDAVVCRINDTRLTPEMERIRSGSTQLFREVNGSRNFTSHENADVILTPPEKNYYAELINGEWHWVNGCAECNGRPRSWASYIECDKHNVCRNCKASRDQITEAPWGGADGWQCKPCADKEHQEEKESALAAAAEKEYDEWDYRHEDEVKCPYCNTTIEDSGDGELYQALDKEMEIECDVCDHTFLLEAESTVTWTMKRIARAGECER